MNLILERLRGGRLALGQRPGRMPVARGFGEAGGQAAPGQARDALNTRSNFATPRRMEAVQTPIIPVVADLIRRHPGTISLGQGVVHWPPPKEALHAAAHFGREPKDHLYTPVAGTTPLLDALLPASTAPG